MKLIRILTLFGYTSTAVGAVYGTITFVLYFVSKYSGVSLDLLSETIQIVSPRVIFFTLLTGGICITDSMILKYREKHHPDRQNPAVTISIVALSALVLAAIYFRIGIGRERGSITIVLWQCAFFILKLIMNSYNRERSE